MAADKAKQKKRGYRKSQYRKTNLYNRIPSKSNFSKMLGLSYGMGGEPPRCRTRAQTAHRMEKSCIDVEETYITDSEEATASSAAPEVRDSMVRVGEISPNETQGPRLATCVQAEPRRKSDKPSRSNISPVEMEEETEEFFMAPEGEEEASLTSGGAPSTTESGKINNVSNMPNQGVDISSTLLAMNSKLSKLDTLENLNIKLEGVQSKVEDVSRGINSVKSELSKYEQRWEETTKGLIGRISELEKTSQSWERRWELQREAVSGDCKILQASIDSNSKRLIELETRMDSSAKRWESINSLETKIQEAADNKFQVVQKVIREDLSKELLKEIKEAKSNEVSRDDLEKVKEDIRETIQDLQKIKKNVETTAQVQSEKGQGKSRVHHSGSPENEQYSRLRGQAFSNRHNILVFGLKENNSSADDLHEVYSFFENRMGLSCLKIKVVFRLGAYRQEALRPRPLVVKFADIRDRWRVWNSKSKIKFDRDHPIRIQEDLPKKLREDHRVLQRIAKVAMENPETYRDVKVKDFRISISGKKYGMEEIHQLPIELQPESVYTPRSTDAVVFFTKNSPMSNHHPAPFTLNGKNFSCVEQYLAFCKAIMAENTSLAERAMESTDPADHKSILNSLRPQVQERWAEKAPAIILPAIRAKFSQNERLSNFLIETHLLAIGEASRDSMWGVGLPLEHKDVLDTTKWERHGNLLGNTLARVRAELIQQLIN